MTFVQPPYFIALSHPYDTHSPIQRRLQQELCSKKKEQR